MRRSRLRRGLAAAVVVAGLALTGAACGDDDDDGDSRLSRSEWIAQADAICEAGDAEIDEAAERTFTGPPDEEQLATFATDVVIPGLEQQRDQIRALETPEGDEGEVDAILTALDEGIEELRDDPSVIASGDPLAEATRLAREYGLEVCGYEDEG